MTVKGEVLSIENIGDAVRITAQLRSDRDARWRPLRKLVLDMAEHEARRYRIGDTIVIRAQRREPR